MRKRRYRKRKQSYRKQGVFRSGDVYSGYVTRINKKNKGSFPLHSRTKKGINKIINYFRKKGFFASV